MLTLHSTITLNNGVEIPRLGLGVYRAEPGPETTEAVLHALDAGYRHVDTAAAYRNEEAVGAAIRESDVPRNDVFVTTKLWNRDHGYDAARAAMDRSLERLGLERVDLYLIHWPVEGLRRDSWRALERILDEGKARAIGVSNYMARHLAELFDHADVLPAVNQIELSPYNYRSRRDTVDLCRDRGIGLEAYSPLTKTRKLDDPPLVAMAEKHGRTSAQVLIRWALQQEFVVIPKSTNPARIRENADAFDFALDSDDMAALEGLDEGLTTGWDPADAP